MLIHNCTRRKGRCKMKKKKLVIVIIIISIILVLGISVAITAPIIIKQYKNNMKQTDNKRNNDEKEVKKTNNTLSEEQIEKILTGLETKPACSKVNPCGKMDYNYYTNKTVKVSDLSQEMVGYVILNHLIKEGLQLKEGETFTKEQVQEKSKRNI